jgi:hypothetical protein
VLLVCHACVPLPLTTEDVALWYWAAETLAEAGYVLLYAAVGGNSVPRTIDATDFLVATATSPTPRGDFNPWYERVDRSRLGIVGRRQQQHLRRAGNQPAHFVEQPSSPSRADDRTCECGRGSDHGPGRGLHAP